MERCPICRGRINEDMQCRRCGADLQQVNKSEKDAELLIGRAIDYLQQGACEQAEQLLLKVQSLQDSLFVRQLLGFTQSENARSNTRRSWPKKWFS